MSREELEKAIYDAFKNIKLEDGVGLHEAGMIDDYYSKDNPKYIEAQNTDERDDWTKLLPVIDNHFFSGVWHFMDDKGIRFHLPCFLLAALDLTIPLDNPLIFTLNRPEDHSFFRLKILNIAQRQVVIDFLNFNIEEAAIEGCEYGFMITDLKKAKDNFEKYICMEKPN